MLQKIKNHYTYLKGEHLYKQLGTMLRGDIIADTFYYFKEAASNGHTKSKVRVYQLYEMCGTTGSICGITRDISIEWLEQASDEGDKQAHYLLGKWHMDEYRYDTAYELFERSGTTKSYVKQGYILYYIKKSREQAFEKYIQAEQMGWHDKNGIMKRMFSDKYNWQND